MKYTTRKGGLKGMTKEDKMNYLKEVKKATNIKQICQELGLNYPNVMGGKTKEENIKKVIDKLQDNIKALIDER